MIRWLLLGAAAALPAAPGSAPSVSCPEFVVNAYTTSYQDDVHVASTPNGDFLVVWRSGSPGIPGIFGHRYDAAGTPLGPEFRADADALRARNVEVALDAAGNAVVVWDTNGIHADVFGQRLDPSGNRLGPQFRVNTETDYEQEFAAVAAHPAGSFVVVWTSFNLGSLDVFGQRYDAAGTPQGQEFRVSGRSPRLPSAPAVSFDAAGGFVVVWRGDELDAGRGVFGQRYLADGRREGLEFRVSTDVVGDPVSPRITHGLNGDFMVVWAVRDLDGSDSEIVARRFDSSGIAQGREFQVNTFTTGHQSSPAIAADSNGGYAVAWSSQGPDGDGTGVAARRLDASGAPIGPEFLLNHHAPGDQRRPSLARGPDGAFVAAWESFGQDGDDYGAVAGLDCSQLSFYAIPPCRVADTRDPPGPSGGPPLGANSARQFPVSGRCGIPADARAVAFNVTAVNATDFGDLRLYPAGQNAPLASAVNFGAGQARAGNGIALLGAGGQVGVRCDMPPGSTGITDLALDLYGYFKR